ncbi:MAG: glycogen synthase [Verrucomicrobia bacterium]|nr:glycogen synthase [Verrucomicrobiota bacterium]
MRIIHVAAEFAPIAKAGGLGEVIVGLSRMQMALLQDVEIIIPKHSFIHPNSLPYLKVETPEFTCKENGTEILNTMWSAEVEGCRLHLLEERHPAAYFRRPNIYGYPDDIPRFIYFSKAVIEYLKLQKQPIDVLHLHEWHTSLCAPLVKEIFAKELNVRSVVLTIHNLEYQGKCATWDLDAIGVKGASFLKPDKLQDDLHADSINLLKGGIVYADAITTVSPTYSKEILTPPLGFNLNKTLTKHKSKLQGILNGIDYKLWNPETDSLLAKRYSTQASFKEIELGKEKNKEALEKRFGLESGKRPWFGAITRLVPQKGPEMIEEAIHHVLASGGVFVLLGSSPLPDMQHRFDVLKEKYKGNRRLVLEFNYDETLAHLIYGALDFTLVPSHFEPCGLTQIIAMRYGTIPIVRSTGGLKDTIFDCDNSAVPIAARNGFTFSHPSELVNTIDRALEIKKNNSATFQTLVKHAIQSDFSWKKPADEYLKLYKKISGVSSSNQPPRIVARSVSRNI